MKLPRRYSFLLQHRALVFPYTHRNLISREWICIKKTFETQRQLTLLQISCGWRKGRTKKRVDTAWQIVLTHELLSRWFQGQNKLPKGDGKESGRRKFNLLSFLILWSLEKSFVGIIYGSRVKLGEKRKFREVGKVFIHFCFDVVKRKCSKMPAKQLNGRECVGINLIRL